MNVIFFALVLVAFVVSGWRQLAWVPASPDAIAPMQALTDAMIATAGQAVTLAIGLIGVMTLFLGLMKVAEAGGLLVVIARTIRPLLARAFPEVPADHPAMGAMILNLSANALGLGNAATPFGIRAMQELDRLNPRKGTATDAMVLFVAINTSSVTLLPTGIIALRAAAGSADPAGILPTTLFATILSTIVAIVAAKGLCRLPPFRSPVVARPVGAAPSPPKEPPPEGLTIALPPEADAASSGYPAWVSGLTLAAIAAVIPLTVIYGKTIAPWIVPGLMIGLLGFGVLRRVAVYEAFVDGAREGFRVAVRIIPYLVAILVAVGMLRASGALDIAVRAIAPVTSLVGLPGEALPMALMRTLSGSGAYALVASIIQDPAIGPDSYTGYLVSTIQGSTETTFYVIAVYFGAVQVRRIRHALVAGLAADIAGVAGSVIACSLLFAR